MALFDRVKERTESALSDAEIQSLTDEALQEIRERYGQDASPANPLVVMLEGDRARVVVPRPINTAEAITVTEYVGTTATVLTATDYRIWYRGRTLERLMSGPNPRSTWGRVQVAYVPVDDRLQREEVAIKLVQLAIDYRGVTEQRVGDTSTTHADYHEQRERLLASLASWRAMVA